MTIDNTCEFIVLGPDHGGYVAAIGAAQLGLKTGTVECERHGGSERKVASGPLNFVAIGEDEKPREIPAE